MRRSRRWKRPKRAHLVVAEQAGRETRYRFVHELIRQTLAERLSLPRRQRLHARVADAIERIHGVDVESQASALAHHLYQAGAAADSGKALKYLMLAAKLATAGAAHEEALAHLDNALSLIEGERYPHAAELHSGRAVALRSLARLSEAVESYERAIALLIEAGDIQAAAETSFQLAGIHGWNADGPGALRVLDHALRLLGAEPSSVTFSPLGLQSDVCRCLRRCRSRLYRSGGSEIGGNIRCQKAAGTVSPACSKLVCTGPPRNWTAQVSVRAKRGPGFAPRAISGENRICGNRLA